MILDRFKSKNVIKQFNKILNTSIENKRLSSDKIKKVLLFVENELDHEVLQSLSDNLNISSSNFRHFIFKNTIEKNEDLENCITKKDFGLLGKFKNIEVNKVLGESFDILVNYTINNEFVSSLVADSNAGFKVGLLDNYSQVYDMIIDVEKGDLFAFNKELRRYLLILNKL